MQYIQNTMSHLSDQPYILHLNDLTIIMQLYCALFIQVQYVACLHQLTCLFGSFASFNILLLVVSHYYFTEIDT